MRSEIFKSFLIKINRMNEDTCRNCEPDIETTAHLFQFDSLIKKLNFTEINSTSDFEFKCHILIQR